jgi:hypothetical protein
VRHDYNATGSVRQLALARLQHMVRHLSCPKKQTGVKGVWCTWVLMGALGISAARCYDFRFFFDLQCSPAQNERKGRDGRYSDKRQVMLEIGRGKMLWDM